ncbi:importin-alpha export receptor, partial [Paramarasmius palmivorus]
MAPGMSSGTAIPVGPTPSLAVSAQERYPRSRRAVCETKYTEKLLESNAVPAFLQGVRSRSNRLTKRTGQSSSTIAACPAMLTFGPSDKGIRAQVAESVALIAELDFPSSLPAVWMKLYTEQLLESNAVPVFVLQGVWSMVGSNSLTSVSDDPLGFPNAFAFLFHLRSPQVTTLSYSLRQKLFLPWLKASSFQMYAIWGHDPLEFIRLELSIGGAGAEGWEYLTKVLRRQAAADVVQSLVGTGG